MRIHGCAYGGVRVSSSFCCLDVEVNNMRGTDGAARRIALCASTGAGASTTPFVCARGTREVQEHFPLCRVSVATSLYGTMLPFHLFDYLRLPLDRSSYQPVDIKIFLCRQVHRRRLRRRIERRRVR